MMLMYKYVWFVYIYFASSFSFFLFVSVPVVRRSFDSFSVSVPPRFNHRHSPLHRCLDFYMTAGKLCVSLHHQYDRYRKTNDSIHPNEMLIVKNYIDEYHLYISPATGATLTPKNASNAISFYYSLFGG